MDKPEVYRLPNAENAGLPGRNNVGGYLGWLVTAVLAVFTALVARRQRNLESAEQDQA
jgi:formate dehydrogenase iron-sulfur subunit